jgi:CMP-N,N'-diacetyllegionaminic acid synthase
LTKSKQAQTKEKILAVIPARGGSKGVLRKNVRLVCGRPLISYTIETALKVQHLLYRVIVSSEDEEIVAIARQYGADVPFLRPSELSSDEVPTLPVLKHAVEFVEKQDGVTLDWVLLLQPTDPFRNEEDIKAALDLAQGGGCDSVISVVQVF